MDLSANKMKIALVRHGQTDWNLKGYIQGCTDIPLNERGLIQAENTAGWFAANGKWHNLYSSHLSRAQKTAAIIGEKLNLGVNINQDLRERAFGALEGMSLEDRERFYPKRLENESSVPELELRDQFRQRVLRTFEYIVGEMFQSNIIIVSHGAWINQLLHYLSNGTMGSGITTLGNGSICIIIKDKPNSWSISEVNLNGDLQEP